jgi:radical SAM superfamily enzyme YgiQ (UPF0313 family)
MKKVLLVSANQEKVPYPAAPLGLLYIAHALKKADFISSILDLCFSRDVRGDIMKSIKRMSPDFVGVSLRNIDNLTYPQSVSYLPMMKEIIGTIKSYTRAPIVLGGSAFSLFPKEILSFLECEWGIVGEGEDALSQLLKRFTSRGNSYKTINNLLWKKGGRIYSNRTKCLRHSVNSVLDYSLIDNHMYSKFAGMANVQTKRGCSFKCAYCTYPLIEGKNYRLRLPEIVAEETHLLKKKYAVPHVFFVDDVFTYPTKHAAAICEALLKKNLKMQWSCFASPYGISKKLLMLMKKAGCTHIEFGSDALSNRVLAKLRKPFMVKEVLRASKLCNEIGIKCAHYIIFGAPGENHASLKEGFATVRKLKGDAIIAMIGIRIYPGTELEKISIREGVIAARTNLLFPRFYLSPGISTDELTAKVKEVTLANPHCIVPGLGIRSSGAMYSILRKHYREGPLWGYLG